MLDPRQFRRVRKYASYVMTSFQSKIGASSGMRAQSRAAVAVMAILAALALWVFWTVFGSAIAYHGAFPSGSESDLPEMSGPGLARARVEAWNAFLIEQSMRRVEIKAFASGREPRCIGIRETGVGVALDGSSVRVLDCTLQSNQRWVLHADSTVRLVAGSELFCMQSHRGRVELGPCASAGVSKWQWDSRGLIMSLEGSGLCLHAKRNVHGGAVTAQKCPFDHVDANVDENYRFQLV